MRLKVTTRSACSTQPHLIRLALDKMNAVGETLKSLTPSDKNAFRYKHQMSFAAQRLTQQRVIEETAANAPGFASSAVKLSNALITQAGDELLINALGTQGVGWEGEFKTTELTATRTWLKQKSLTIAGGTMEVQKNIIAKRVLGLPD